MLIERMDTDLKNAMKAKNEVKVGTLRLLRAAIKNKEIEKKVKSLSENELLEIIQKQVKQRKDSIEEFKKAARQDLVKKETSEISVLEEYLPKQLTESELKTLVQEAIQTVGAKTKADLGKVMKEVMSRAAGKADGKQINQIVSSFSISVLYFLAMNLAYALLASLVVSLISLIGVATLIINDKLLKSIIFILIAFAAGSLIGGAFLEILPEAIEHTQNEIQLFLFVILGYVLFFVLEKYLHWHHHHDEECEVHMFTYLNLIGDGIHNFCDGLIIDAVFLTDVRVGIATTLAIILHEIPQELGDFMVLIYGGFSKGRALFFNFVSASFAILGTLVGYFFAHKISGFSAALLPLAAGGFIYIASCDLIPELRKETDPKKSILITAAFLLGIGLMYWLEVGV